MNVYAVLVLVALVGEYLLQLVADVLNLRALDPEPPAEFEDAVDAETYRRSQEYTRARTRFGLVPATAGLAAVLAFWGLGGFGWLDEQARALGGGPIVTGLVFIGALAAAQWALGLPFELWSTFVIEERFGFNRTDARTFWTDRAKGLLLAACLGGPLLAGVLFFFEWAGGSAWLWCWGLTAAFVLGVQVVAPTWILPLFNRFEPLGEGELRSELLGYARSVSFPLDDVFVVDGSRRSTKANAFFTGFGRRKRVALFDTLVEKQSVPELVGVLAHEIGHYKRRHIPRMTLFSILQLGVIFWLLSLFLESEGLFAAFGVEELSTHAGLVFFGLLFAPIQLVLSGLYQAYSRHCEFEADDFAAETTRAPDTLASALRKLAVDNLSNLTPHPFYVLLHYSHPPTVERIRALRAGASGAS